MKVIYLLFTYLFILTQQGSPNGLPGSSSFTGAFEPSPSVNYLPNGITVAGGNGQGASSTQFNQPSGVSVDAYGNLYVLDRNNARVQKFAPGTATAITVAGGNGIGASANQFGLASGFFVDASGNIYVADPANNRVQKWAPGASAGVTVAGGNGAGTAANQLNLPISVFVDGTGNIFVSDRINSRIQKWAPGASSGITVAGSIGSGSAANKLNAPFGIFIDQSGSIYIADQNNHRIQKWLPGASEGITVAGGNGRSNYANQLNYPTNVFVDAGGNIFIVDFSNIRIQRWTPGASGGFTVAGGYGVAGSAPNKLNNPGGIFVDSGGSLYVADAGNNRIQKFLLSTSTEPSQNGITVAGDIVMGSGASQLYSPTGITVDANGNLYIADVLNNRVQRWTPGASAGVTVAGGNGAGSSANQLHYPNAVFIDEAGNLYIVDQINERVQKWAPGASAGVTVAGGNGQGTAANQLYLPSDISVDKDGNVYIADGNNHRIQKWAPGASEGITVLGGNGTAPGANQLGSTGHLFIDAAGNIYVNGTSSIQKWAPGASTGVIVAGGNGTGSAANQLNGTSGIFVDTQGNVYIADFGNYRVQKWLPGATSGITVAAGNGEGNQANQLDSPTGIFVDAAGNLFVADASNNRIQKFAANDINNNNGLNYKYYEGTFSSLPDFSTLTPVKAGTSPNVDITVRTPGRDDNFAFVWEGFINIPAAGNYTFETVSDDGSKVYFGTLYNPSATATVSNDGVHGPWSPVSGTVNIPAAGVYPISITYFEKDGGEQMNVYWTGPSIERQLIPNSAFVQGGTPPPDGLTYKYYEGTWDMLPDFNQLTPVKTGNSANVDLGVRTPGRDDNFAFVWQGNINITTPGTYTFETVSDDGSKFYFNLPYDAAATATVNNDGLHAPVSASGTVNITAAGSYPITITFFEKDGGETMQVYWTGPGISRQLIPNSAFGQASPPPPQKGLTYKYYEGAWDVLPDFNGLTPVKTGTSPNTDISVRTPGRDDNFAFLWQGGIIMPSVGNYTFETISDDGSKLYFNMTYDPAATPTVNNDGLHAAYSATGIVSVPAAGPYPIAISFFEKDGGENMQVYWSGPGIDRQLVPDSAFVQMPPVSQPGITGTNNTKASSGEMTKTGTLISRIYPNPFSSNLNIDFYNASAGNDINLGIYDLKGTLVYRQHASRMQKGNTTIKVNLDGRMLPPGVYMASLTINGVPLKMTKLIKVK